MAKGLEDKIRQICTYYSELGEGSAGYCLSEEQFTKLLSLIDNTVSEVIGEDEDIDDYGQGKIRDLFREEQRLRYKEMRGGKK